MATPIVIADEFTAAGFRLAGARTIVPSSHTLIAAFEGACNECDLLLLTATLAAALPANKLATALAARRPLLLVIPDALRRRDPPDLARELQRTLGVET